MAKYRKKPIVVEAVPYEYGMEDTWRCALHGSSAPCSILCGKKVSIDYTCPYLITYIETLEGEMRVQKGDYIVTGIKGERYPIKKDIFEMTYEPASESTDIPDALKVLEELRREIMEILPHVAGASDVVARLLWMRERIDNALATKAS